MTQKKFKVTFYKGEHGHTFPVLTAQEYPYPNLQVVPLNDATREYVLLKLRLRGDTITQTEGHDEFCIILAGGTSTEHPRPRITQQNHKAIDNAILRIMQEAADWWALHQGEFIKI